MVPIPVIDVGSDGPLALARAEHERARALRDDCIASLPGPVGALLAPLDGVTRRWLARSRSPYVGEIAAIAAALDFAGVWFLNGSYEWGCTSAAREEDGAPRLARTLDWPFHGLGRYLVVARMRGAAGEYYNVTWPGYVGALTAMAPGRFAVTINQAPLWRRTRRPWLRPYDLVLNALDTWRLPYCPPAHLLREVLDTCRDFAGARDRLECTPVARPAIVTLVGCAHGETCVIERREETFVTRMGDVAAANDWEMPEDRWEARVPPDVLLTRSPQEAQARSRARRDALAAWRQPLAGFAWVVPPVLNPYTRLAVEMCPYDGTLRVIGYERADDEALPQPVSRLEAAA